MCNISQWYGYEIVKAWYMLWLCGTHNENIHMDMCIDKMEYLCFFTLILIKYFIMGAFYKWFFADNLQHGKTHFDTKYTIIGRYM